MNGGPANVNVELLSPNGDVVSSALTSHEGNYVFSNIIPGMKYILSIYLIGLKRCYSLILSHFLQMLVEFFMFKLLF